jgi:hypothetical protein
MIAGTTKNTLLSCELIEVQLLKTHHTSQMFSMAGGGALVVEETDTVLYKIPLVTLCPTPLVDIMRQMCEDRPRLQMSQPPHHT